MSKSILDMSMSLDGYIADENDYLGGEDGERLHHWADADGGSAQAGPVREFEAEWKAAGSVLAGRRTAELMDHWGGSHGGAPIFVPSHRPPPPAARWGYPLVTYVNDGIESAMALAKAAAGDRDVQLRGGYTAQEALRAGVLDEIQIHLIPVLLGRGRRLFDVLPSEIELELVRVIDTPAATHIRYRVRRQSSS
ncbi:dihydrofolate reductase family protein [Rhizobium sp. YTUHZ044]|uniref:dihydrofolate reductase family protein n=1 Tax=Rhizobium sp. YTUHZ044 TaxID=2962678 RepID=UPI003DA96D59